MVANLDGVVFDQVYGDNSGGPEFDTDGDGTATQEDEFVSVTNTTDSDVDISGWEVWSDSTGSAAPDAPQDGKFHTFPPGTVLKPGETLYVINEISGTPKNWMQEASEGGVESGAGGVSTNLLGEGQGTASNESVGLVNPANGEFIVFNTGSDPEQVSSLSGFPGTTKVGEVDGEAVQADQGAGFSYQYDSDTDSYTYEAVFVPCFASGTLIAVPDGQIAVENLRVGDLVDTLDNGPQPLRAIIRRELEFSYGENADHLPIEFKPGSLGPNQPTRPMIVSPQHRIFIHDVHGREVLAPAKSLTHLTGVRVMKGRRRVQYIQLVFEEHQVLCSEGAWTESFYPGPYAFSSSSRQTQVRLLEIFPELRWGQTPPPARPLLRARVAAGLSGSSALGPVACAGWSSGHPLQPSP